MNLQVVEKIADAVLYEGYLLYPYRPSAVKNQRRFNFGVLVPQSYSEAQVPGTEPCSMQTECLLLGDSDSSLDVKVRFLHLCEQETNGTTWQEAVTREVDASNLKLSSLMAEPHRVPILYSSTKEEGFERDACGEVGSTTIRNQETIEGVIELQVADCGLTVTASKRLFKIQAKILNLTPLKTASAKSRDEALMFSLVSAHTIFGAHNGEFVSLLDPPEEFREAAAGCQNIGVWPVLAGEEGRRDLLLSSPIILYDYPQIAPESAGDLFDGAEIDEILTLRIMTLTDAEKEEMRGTDERARQILERIETLSLEQLMKLHGAMRGLRALENDPLSESHERIGMASAGR
ncbi:MAG: hypothetical protein JST85_26985 [Acidobacteria bacterium]|nr:hypothetical protein [Acidobacteriota bacterium]